MFATMQLKFFFILGVFIILQCMFPSEAQEQQDSDQEGSGQEDSYQQGGNASCTAIDDSALNAIKTKINNFRSQHNVQPIKFSTAPAGIDENKDEFKFAKHILSEDAEVDTKDEADVLVRENGKIQNTAASLGAIIDGWLKLEEHYHYDGQIKDKKLNPFVRILWAGTDKAFCQVCVDNANGAKNSFGCRFSPAAQLFKETNNADVETIKNNLPAIPVKKPSSQSSDESVDSESKDENNPSNGSNGTNIVRKRRSTFENTIRTSLSVIFIFIFVLVVLTCAVSILTATRVFRAR